MNIIATTTPTSIATATYTISNALSNAHAINANATITNAIHADALSNAHAINAITTNAIKANASVPLDFSTIDEFLG